MQVHDQINEAVIVTGATGGIGSAIVEALYRESRYVVIGACRNPGRLDALQQKLKSDYPCSKSRLLDVSLDLATKTGAISSAAETSSLLKQQGLSLHGIINNAGVMPVDHLEVSPDGMEMTLQVNCISTLAFTMSLVPIMTDGGVIVMTSSIMRKLPVLDIDFDKKALGGDNFLKRFNNYGRSKLLLTLCARHLADRLAGRNIRVNCADPGVVDSGIIHLGYPLVDKLADLIARPLMSSTQKGALAALNAMNSPLTALMHTRTKTSPLPSITSGKQKIIRKAFDLSE